MATGCLTALGRDVEADSAAPWQRDPPLDHVRVAAVRSASPCLYCCTGTKISLGPGSEESFHSHDNTQTIVEFPNGLVEGSDWASL